MTGALHIDESSKSANASRRRRAWSPRGAPAVIVAYFQRRHDPRCTLIAACDCNGFTPEACLDVHRENSRDNDPDKGTVDTERFLSYVKEFVTPILGYYSLGEPRSIVIMDNASIHHSGELERIINEAGALLIYTAPYSPEYNPIELMFGDYKDYLKRHSLNRTETWFELHWAALLSVSPKKARNYYRKCKVPWTEAFFGSKVDEEELDAPLPEPFQSFMEVAMESLGLAV